MDVGLNNKNTFEHEQLKDVVFLVEATSPEQHNLWQEWAKDYRDVHSLDIPIKIPEKFKLFEDSVRDLFSPELRAEIEILKMTCKRVAIRNDDIAESQEHRVDWEQMTGVLIHIGNEIYLSFSFVKINGKKIAFYYPSSAKVDYTLIEKWLIKHFQRTHDNYTRWNHTDAQNFHNCVNSLDDIDEKPRKTKYNGKHAG